MTKNLTEGNPLKLILLFSLPLLAGNLFQQAYNLVDAAIVGRYLGTMALAGVGASGSVNFLVLGFCMGICAGFTIPVAQKFGAGDYSAMRSYIFIGAVSLALFSVVVTVVCSLLCRWVLGFMSTPADIFDNAYIYLLIIFLGSPFTLMYNFLSGILRAIGNSKTPFIFLVVATIVNIVLDLTFIIVFNMGVAGAALATVAAQAVSGILCLVHIMRRYEILRFRKEDLVWNWKKLSVLFGMGIPMGLQFSITAIGSMALQAANNSLGSVCVSGFTAGSKLKILFISPYDAIGTAVSTYAGQNLGAQKFDRIKQGILLGTAISVLYGIAASISLIAFGRPLSLMFIDSSETEVLNASVQYAAIIGIFYWVLGILNVVRPSLQGLGFTSRAIFSGVIEMFARCTVSFGLVPVIGYKAVCFADPCAWVSAVIYVSITMVWCLSKIKKAPESIC